MIEYMSDLGYVCKTIRNNEMISIGEITDNTEETNFFFEIGWKRITEIRRKNMEHDVKIACCVFTHNHAETMKDILDRAFPVYCHFGIDIYIYDDSTDQLTEDIVLEYIERQSGHIF